MLLSHSSESPVVIFETHDLDDTEARSTPPKSLFLCWVVNALVRFVKQIAGKIVFGRNRK